MMSQNTNISILGAGNLGIAIAEGARKAGLFQPEQIFLTRRNPARLEALRSQAFRITTDNTEAVRASKLVLLCVQPKQLGALLQEIGGVLNEAHIVVSTITGVSIEEITSAIANKQVAVVRAMPNTAVGIGASMTCICSQNAKRDQLEAVTSLFESLGETLLIEERLMKAATVLAASGIAFCMRYLRAATQAGIQLGFDAEEAQKIAVQTAKGAALLIQKNHSHPEVEIDRVTTPEGCTIAGLNEMEHQGLSSALIKGILTSFEKINTIRK
jgi:pyrroline-5-carboxylate reductase